MISGSVPRRLLHVVCGDRKLPGFINIDTTPGADVVQDVSAGLPCDNNTAHGIFSGNYPGKMSQPDAVAFLRECRRVLVNHGRLRIGTAGQVTGQWLCNEEELVRLATVVGLKPVARQRPGASDMPEFRGLEDSAGSHLVYEFEKDRPANNDREPLVSILIPAFNPRYLRDSLDSAISQTWRNTEIIVSDDNPATEAIRELVEPLARADARIRYIRNTQNLGDRGRANHIQCFELARGEFIKFLNDDDLLRPDCVRRMAGYLVRFPDVTLVTSHRQRIDAAGTPLPIHARPVKYDSIIDGVAMAASMLKRKANFIGEPTTTMFRRSDMAGTLPNILSFAGRECIASADMTMWVNLLSKGDGIYLVDSLSCLRKHPEQAQLRPEFKQRREAALEQLTADAKRMGMLQQPHAGRPLVQRLDTMPNPAA